MTTTLRVRFDGKVLVPEGPVDLPKDQSIELQVIPPRPAPGSPAAIRDMLSTLEPLSKEDMAEFERSIEESLSSRRPEDEDIFKDWEPKG